MPRISSIGAYHLVARIHDDMHSLSVTLHYLTCDGGVGRKRGRVAE